MIFFFFKQVPTLSITPTSMAFYVLFLYSLLYSVTLSSSSLPSSKNFTNPEVEALISVRRGLNDPNGVLKDWDEASASPCNWTRITCSKDGLVINLIASRQNLSGTLSRRIGNLKYLRNISLKKNNISGGIPPEIGYLPNLEYLDLSYNRFSGLIPDKIGQLNSLEYLILNNNTFSGVLPLSLAKLPHLELLGLSFNNLSGPVPKFPDATIDIEGNSLICGGNHSIEGCSGLSVTTSVPPSSSCDSNQKKPKSHKVAVALVLGIVSVQQLLFWS